MNVSSTRLVNADNLGAWVVKCRPEPGSEVLAALRSSRPAPLTRWCVADNYRSRMMSTGDPALLWVSGDGRRLARGIWGLGRVTGQIRDMDEFMVGKVEMGRKEVPLHIELLGAGVTVQQIRDAGVGDLEVLVQPQSSNPSWVSRTQLTALSELLDGWPDDR